MQKECLLSTTFAIMMINDDEFTSNKTNISDRMLKAFSQRKL